MPRRSSCQTTTTRQQTRQRMGGKMTWLNLLAAHDRRPEEDADGLGSDVGAAVQEPPARFELPVHDHDVQHRLASVQPLVQHHVMPARATSVRTRRRAHPRRNEHDRREGSTASPRLRPPTGPSRWAQQDMQPRQRSESWAGAKGEGEEGKKGRREGGKEGRRAHLLYGMLIRSGEL
eukprot:1247694-Rhodomonas_salina.3